MAVCELASKKPCQRAVRAWVLTFPIQLRFLLAAQPEALTQVLADAVDVATSNLFRVAFGSFRLA